MSVVWVRRDEAAQGRLPARCARTGTRCITRYRYRVSDLPAATEWATWTGLWPRSRQDEGAAIVLPLLPGRHRAVVWMRRLRDVTAALLPISLVLMVLTGQSLPGRLASGLTIGVVLLHLAVAVVGWSTTVEIRIDRTGEWVRLSGVHPEFESATEAITSRPEVLPVLSGATVATSAARRTAGDPLES